MRGICCLKPGVEGYTDNITIHSVVGRHLEHSRIFAFGQGAEQRIFVGSGDLLNRNTQHRVEVFIECTTPEVRQDVLYILQMLREDRERSWTMRPDGTYRREEIVPGTSSQDRLYEYFGTRTVEALPAEQPPVTAAPPAAETPPVRGSEGEGNPPLLRRILALFKKR